MPLPRTNIPGAILVVDDDADVARSIATLLESRGTRCHVALTYRAALDVLTHQEDVRVVVIDHGDLRITLREFVEALRRIGPDLVLVGSSGEDCSAEFAAHGIPHFLRKPWHVEQLYDVSMPRFAIARGASLPRGIGDRRGGPIRHLVDPTIERPISFGGRRREERFPRRLPVTVDLGGRELLGLLTEVSARGARLQLPALGAPGGVPAIGQEVAVSTLGHHDRFVVVWSTEHPTRRFVGLSLVAAPEDPRGAD